jgi:hypothetical protein
LCNLQRLAVFCGCVHAAFCGLEIDARIKVYVSGVGRSSPGHVAIGQMPIGRNSVCGEFSALNP